MQVIPAMLIFIIIIYLFHNKSPAFFSAALQISVYEHCHFVQLMFYVLFILLCLVILM